MQRAGKKMKGAARKEDAGSDRFYKIGEVCAMTDTQPYVLRFWESEIPLLAPRKSRSGQRLYQKKDVDLVIQIKRLLYDEEYTIPGARKKLEEMGFGDEAAAEVGASGGAPSRRSGPGSARGRRKTQPALGKLRKELKALRKMLDS